MILFHRLSVNFTVRLSLMQSLREKRAEHGWNVTTISPYSLGGKVSIKLIVTNPWWDYFRWYEVNFDVSNCQWLKCNKCPTPGEQRKWIFLYWLSKPWHSRWPSSAYHVPGSPFSLPCAKLRSPLKHHRLTEELGDLMNPHQMVLTCVCNSRYFHPRKGSRPTAGLTRQKVMAWQTLQKSPHRSCAVSTRMKCLLSLFLCPDSLMLLTSW